VTEYLGFFYLRQFHS